MVPARQGLDVLPAGHHVGVEPLDDLAVGGLRPGVDRVGDAPAVAHAYETGVERPDLGQADGRVAAVVDDQDLHEVLRVRLRGQRRERQVELVLPAARGYHHADGKGG
ncbi:hypothetical protein GCM10020001_065720 [Nonomuraea salmonea]